MRHLLAALGGFALLGACAPGDVFLDENTARRALAAAQCSGPDAGQCTFVNSPVRLVNEPVKLATRRADFYPTAESMQFIDARSSRWNAPTRTLTDGASIPRIFVSIVGDPRSREFVNAAAMHDAQCGIGNENLKEYHSQTWQDTHRMFYDALRVGGTPEIKAKVMFAAVYLGGPRWNDPLRDLRAVNRNAMRREMARAKGIIERDNPTIPWIIRYLERLERRVLNPMEPEEETEMFQESEIEFEDETDFDYVEEYYECEECGTDTDFPDSGSQGDLGTIE